MKNLQIIFFGTPHFVLPVLTAVQKNFSVVGVVTTPDTYQGRRKMLTPSPVKQFILDQKLNLPIFTPEKMTAVTVEELRKLKPDLFVVAAYGKIIPQSLLDIPTFGSINVHPSLLPKYRGPSPIQTTILNGDKNSGITLILMDRDVDHGPILSQEKVPIVSTDNFATLHVSMFEKAAKMLIPTILNFVNKKIQPVEQDHDKATFCEHITRESGYFDLGNPPSPEHLNAMIRAYYPWPTAWTRFKNKNGENKIIKFFPENRIQLEGKNPTSLKDFFNGHPEMKDILERLLRNE